ncbi:MAG: cytochrome c maturation protein CcmE [Candidatus Kapaibacterium sp.]
MKPRYIIGAIVILAFAAVAIFSFNSEKIEYSNFATAKNNDQFVQVIGSWERTTDCSYNAEINQFTFTMKDKEDNVAKVVYSGSKPNNFDIAPMVVVKGRYEGDIFKAEHILTKCPSKYEDDMGSENEHKASI